MGFIKTSTGKIVSEIKTDKDGNIKAEASLEKSDKEPGKRDGGVSVQSDEKENKR